MNGSFFSKLYLGSAGIGLLLILGSLILWNSWTIPVGLLAGITLGVVPFLSWHLVARLFLGPPNRWRRLLGIAITVLKYGFVALALYILITRKAVDTWGLLIGMLSVMVVCLALGFQKTSHPTTEGSRE